MLARQKAKRFAIDGDVDRLLELLAHGKRRERHAAARALGEMGDERAVEPLIAALAAAYGDDEDMPPIIVSALGALRGTSAVDAMTTLLANRTDDGFYFLAHREALFALAELGAFEPLEQVSQDETRDRHLRGEAEALIRKHTPRH